MALVTTRTSSLTGFKELAQTLRALPESMKPGRILNKAVKKAANLILEEAKARCPQLTGDLRASLSVELGSATKEGLLPEFAAGCLIGPVSNVTKKGRKKLISRGIEEGNPAVYARFVERGTRFTRPKPFLGPAFDAQEDNAINELGNEVGYQIDQVWSSGA